MIRASVVDLFCGAGGLSLGLKNAGLKVVAGCDIDIECEHAFESNVGARFYARDVEQLTSHELEGWFAKGQAKVLAACAPCQPFSGYVVGRYDPDERYRLLLQVARIISEVKPDVVTVENVPRLAFRRVWNRFLAALKRNGYHLDWDILDASYYGVPQRRRRLVLVASRLGPITLPEPSSEDDVPTVRDAIASLPPIAAGEICATDELHRSRNLSATNLKRIRASKPGGTWRDWDKKLRADCHKSESGKTYPSVYGRMSWDEPSPTITTQFYGFGNGRFGHPEQDRALSIREAAILQGFPQDYVFAAPGAPVNFMTYSRLIGNAVPVGLAEAIGGAIKQHLQGTAGVLKSRAAKKPSTPRKTAST